ncbi:hypothetical protein [Polymorphospora sp. NPDC050346]|uniref:hypothetical protein n=1 Tax=Polymorphospora sp. NPDC050346 TaxID=3155780 RepID=UPI0033F41222
MDPTNRTPGIIPALFVGDLVCIAATHARRADHGIVYEITKENPVNWGLTPINGNGSPVRCPPQGLRRATDKEIEAARAAAGARLPELHRGQVVTAPGLDRHVPDTLWTVIRTHPGGAVDVARLGGDNGRFHRAVARKLLTELPAPRLAAVLAAAQQPPASSPQ